MKAPITAKWLGYVRIQIRGANAERLINALIAKHIVIWDVARIEEGKLRFYMLLPDARRLRPLLKETGCRMHVEARYGMPYSMKLIRKRSFFVAGLFLFALGLYMLSSLVWTIDVRGTDRIPEEQVLAAARQEGIFPFQWSFRLKDMNSLSKGVQKRLENTSWVGVTKQGTKIVIHVVESTIPPKRDLHDPRHLVAKVDAVVTQIIAEQGKAKVRANTKVSKGTVLISGNVGTDENMKLVAAKGIVRGLVWHEYDITAPLISKQKVYTGEMKERGFVQTGDRRLQLYGFGDIEYEYYEIIEELSPAKWKWLSLPLSWINEKILEVQYVSEERSEAEAVQVGLEQARVDIKAKYGKDADIKMEKILHQSTDNGKVKLKVLFEVEQSIAEEQVLIHGT
ncbi:sporulation protein YqfD [Paenibacillus marinisediminis]